MLKSKMQDLYRLNNIVRYNPHPKVGTETVAAHSFFTSLFVIDICTRYKLSDTIKLQALEGAVLHDVPEAWTNDITHDVKEQIPEIRELLKPIEQNIISEISINGAITLFTKNPDSNQRIARLVVELADVMSVVQYCRNESLLGNKFFDDMYEQSLDRVRQAEIALEEEIKHAKEQ